MMLIWGGVSALYSYMFNIPVSLGKQDFAVSLSISTVKMILVVGYFTIGTWLSSNVEKWYIQIVFWITSVVFALIGGLAYLTHWPSWSMSGSRVISTVNDPNVAGWILLLGLTNAIILLGSSRKISYLGIRISKIKPIIVVSIPLYIFVLFMTGSRTSIFALSLLGIVLLWQQKHRTHQVISVFLIVLIALAIGLNIDHNFNSGRLFDQITERIFESSRSALDFREVLRHTAFEMGKDNISFGVGTGQFTNFSVEYFEKTGVDTSTEYFQKAIAPKVPHNTYVTFFSENGLVGLLLYITFILISFKNSKHYYEQLFVIWFAVYGFFFNIEGIRMIWLFMGASSIFSLDSVNENQVDDSLSTDHVLLSKKNICLYLGVLLLIVVLFSSDIALSRPKTIIDGKSIVFNTNGGDMQAVFEFDRPVGNGFRIEFIGETGSHYKITVSKGSEFYGTKFELPSGKYKVNFYDETRQVQFIRGYLKEDNSEVGYYVYPKMFKATNLGVTKSDKTYLSKFKLFDIMDSRNYLVEQVNKSYIAFDNHMDGANFENKIGLLSLQRYDFVDRDNIESVKLIWTFRKTADIDVPYMMYVHAVPLEYINGKEETLIENVSFNPPLDTIEVNQMFEAEITIKTENMPYVVNYGFYYWDPITRLTEQPFPKKIYQGYIK